MNPEATDPLELGPPPVADQAPVEPAEPTWAPSQEEWQQMQETNQALAEFVQRQQQMFAPQQGDPQQNGPDFYEDPDAWLNHKLEQRLAPYQSFQQDIVLEEAEQRALDILADDATRNGEFDTSLARARAEQLLPQFQQRYGQTPQAAEAALAAAAQAQRDWEQQFAERAVNVHTNHISTLAGAPGEPGSTIQAGVQQRTMPNYREGGSVTDTLFGRSG